MSMLMIVASAHAASALASLDAPAAAQRFFGFYGVNTDMLHTTQSFSNIVQVSSIDNAIAAMYYGQRSLLLVEGAFFTKGHLRPDYAQSWANLATQSKPLLANGTLVGFNLGDELVWACTDPEAVSKAAAVVRSSFPVGSAIIWYNEAAILSNRPMLDSCGNDVTSTFEIPHDLDWFSIDLYHFDGVVDDWVNSNVRAYYEKWIFPNLTKLQRVALVPGAYGSDHNKLPNGSYVCNRSCYDAMCATDSADYYSWAAQDDRVAAVLPWIWDGCPGCKIDEIGAKDMPLTRSAWAEYGKKLIAL